MANWRGPLYHTFRGHRWRVRFVSNLGNFAGHCDGPDVGDKEIVIRKEGSDKLEELDTLLHELLHAAYWDLDESAIATGAESISRFLWRLGYRRK